MKKKMILTMIITIAMTTLVGCSSMPDLTEAENAKVASYLASVVLDYHSNTKSRILAVSLEDVLLEEELEEEVVEEEELEEELTDGEGTDMEVEEVIPVNTNLADILPMNGVTLMLQEYQIMNQYEASDGLGIYAKDGNQLVSVVYQMVNSTNEAQELSFFSLNMSASLFVNGGVGIRNMITIFNGDMVMMQETIEAGEQLSGFIMFEVPSALLTNISTMQMEVRVSGQSATITMAGITNYVPQEGEVLEIPDLEELEEELLEDELLDGQPPENQLPEEGGDELEERMQLEELLESEEAEEAMPLGGL